MSSDRFSKTRETLKNSLAKVNPKDKETIEKNLPEDLF